MNSYSFSAFIFTDYSFSLPLSLLTCSVCHKNRCIADTLTTCVKTTKKCVFTVLYFKCSNVVMLPSQRLVSVQNCFIMSVNWHCSSVETNTEAKNPFGCFFLLLYFWPPLLLPPPGTRVTPLSVKGATWLRPSCSPLQHNTLLLSNNPTCNKACFFGFVEFQELRRWYISDVLSDHVQFFSCYMYGRHVEKTLIRLYTPCKNSLLMNR